MKIILFVLVSLLAIGSLAYGRELTRADFVKDINTLFLKGDYSALVRGVGGDLRRYRLGRKDKKEVLYLVGLSYLKLNEFLKARKSFCDILDIGGEEFKEDAHISMADSYFEERNFNAAIDGYNDVLRMYPASDRLSSVYYNLGASYKEKKDSKKANFYFWKLKELYKGSFEADKLSYLPAETKEVEFHIIQLGAFRKLRNAKKLVRKLSRKKYDSYIQKIRKDGNVLYRVRGGKFSNKYYARRLLRRLRKDGFQAKIVEE